MEKELFYTTLNSDGTASIRLYGEIGFEVNAAVFSDELAYVESLGVTEIAVRINSCGGNVVEGFGIFSAMLNSKARITTYNDGLAASTASWLFLAGAEAVMADYALLMIHNPYSQDTSRKAQEVVGVMRQSILTILAGRTGQHVETLSTLMNEETWFDAASALASGFATRIEATQAMIQLEPEVQSVKAMYEVCNSILNKNIMTDNENQEALEASEETQEVMNQSEVEAQAEAVTDSSTESEPVAAVSDVEVVAQVEETEPEDSEKAELARENAELQAELAAMKATLNKFEQEAEAKAQAEKKAAATLLVTNAITAGKIKADTQGHWLNMATTSYDLAKTSLDSINGVNKTNPGIMTNVKNSSTEKAITYRELDRNNSKELARIKSEEPAYFNQLFFDAYGTYPNA